jgi:thiamine pyrophosphokinase
MKSAKKNDERNCIIVCDGQINKRLLFNLLNSPKASKKTILISADGASNTLYRLNIIPDYIIGDLDSISEKALNYFKRKKVHIEKISEQEHNDLEKSINFAISKGIKEILVIGFAGKKIDHTLNNFSVLERNYKRGAIRFIDKRFEIFFIDKEAKFDYRKGVNLSLFGMPKAEGIETHGLKYELNKEKLEFGIREGALNLAVENVVKIKFRKGHLLVFKEHFGKIGQLVTLKV